MPLDQLARTGGQVSVCSGEWFIGGGSWHSGNPHYVRIQVLDCAV